MIPPRKPTREQVVEEQRQYSAGRIMKIEQSNHKLDEIEAKMRALMRRDMSKGEMRMGHGREFDAEVNSQKVDRYFYLGKKQENAQCDHDELLLGDNLPYYGDRIQKANTYNQFSIAQQQKTTQLMHSNTLNNDIKPKRNKSSSSLRILKKQKPMISQAGHNQTPDENPRTCYPVNLTPSASFPLSHPPSYSQKDIQPAVISPNLPAHTVPHPTLIQITHLQQMMLKSIQIKEKQLQLASEELQQLQRQKLEEYRKHTELEVELENIRQFRKMVQGNGNRVEVTCIGNSQIKEIYCQALKQKQLLEKGCEKLQRELKLLEEQEFKLKLQKKKVKFQYNSLERQFSRIYKNRSRRRVQYQSKAKQNIPDNSQQQDPITQRQLSKRKNSSKKFITHNKKSLSQLQPSNLKQPIHQNTKHPNYSTIKQQIPSNDPSSFTTTHKKSINPTKTITKSTSHTGIHQSSSKNRHSLNNCQHNKCQTNQILYSMVNELDKLKDIVNKEIIKTKKRKTIDLNGVCNSNRDNKVSGFR